MVPLPRADVDTDQIIPQQFLKRTERTGYGDFVFHNWARDNDGKPRQDFVINEPKRQSARVLVTGRNFGCGSSREHAVWAIQDWGFEAVIAPSFADIFKNNAINVGLLPVELPARCVEDLIQLAADPEAKVKIDLDRATVSTPQWTEPFLIDENARYRLLNGLDAIGETLRLESEIAAFEEQRTSWMPTVDVTGR